MLGVVSVLDNRERAMVLWSVVMLAYVWRQDHTIGTSIFRVLRAIFSPKLSLVWALAGMYSTAIVIAARAAGLWHTSAIKETVYWFVGTAAVLTGKAMTARAFDRSYTKRLARTAVRITVVVEFLVNLYVMPLIGELVLVPLVALLAMMQVVAEGSPEFAGVSKLLDRALVLIGLALAGWVAVSALTDVNGLLTREHAERLLLVPAFTLAFVPFLYFMWRWSRWEQDRMVRRWRERHLNASPLSHL